MKLTYLRSALSTGIIAAAFLISPLGASAAMRTVERSEISHLEVMEDSGFAEFYQHPDIASFPFRSIYIEPVRNDMTEHDIYERRYRPHQIDALAELFYENLVEAMAPTGILVDEPTENTLVISTRLTDILEYDERTTGTSLGAVPSANRMRGNAAMEMVWYAGPGGEMVTALRDGRRPENHAPVTDRDDMWTDSKDIFLFWSASLANYFGAETAATN